MTPEGILHFDRVKLARFKKVYEKTKGNSFVFEDFTFFKGYAHYLIEYLETQLRDGAARGVGVRP